MFLVEISALGAQFESSYNRVFKILASKDDKVIGCVGHKSDETGSVSNSMSEAEAEAAYQAKQEQTFRSIYGKRWSDPGRNILLSATFAAASVAEIATKLIRECGSFGAKDISSAAAKLVAEFIDEEYQEDFESATAVDEDLGQIKESDRLAMLRHVRGAFELKHDEMTKNALLGVSEKSLDVDELLNVIESQADAEIDGLLELEQEQERARKQSMLWGMF